MSDPAELARKIRVAVAHCTLGVWPTPLDQAPVAVRALEGGTLWLKREDRSSGRCGGNKVRGLEFLLAGAPRGTVFVTAGATGSTHCLATAAHAPALGCRTALAQFPQPDTAASQAVAQACVTHAALIVRAPSRARFPLALLNAWRRARRLGPRRWIPGGGAHPRAVLGHLLAALELADQLAQPPDAILTPLGTGGTAAGLLLGVRALGWSTPVVGVRVAPVLVANRWRTWRLARAAAGLLRRHGVTDLSLPAFPRAPFQILEGMGRGYGYPTAAGEAARREGEALGLLLDPAYGAKALAALPALAARGYRRVVFWHTFALPSRAPGFER